jgi:cobalt-zinc-cadmium efflux system protein
MSETTGHEHAPAGRAEAGADGGQSGAGQSAVGQSGVGQSAVGQSGGGGGGEGHGHSHGSGANRRSLGIAIAIVSCVLVIEVFGAFFTGSLALFADAGHMLSDLFGLIIALIATIVAARPANERHSYGYQRAEVFGALANGTILVVVAVFVTIEAIERLLSSSVADVQAGPMLVVAFIGIVANIASMLVLRAGAKTSINMRGAYLEVFGDLLGSIAVILAAIAILVTGFEKADAIASLLIAAMIVPRAFSLLRDVFGVLAQSTPSTMNVQEMREHILAEPGVAAVHDVHLWAITSGRYVFSAHIVVQPEVFAKGDTDLLLDSLASCLSEHFDVEHSTFQLEPEEHADHEDTPHI